MSNYTIQDVNADNDSRIIACMLATGDILCPTYTPEGAPEGPYMKVLSVVDEWPNYVHCHVGYVAHPDWHEEASEYATYTIKRYETVEVA